MYGWQGLKVQHVDGRSGAIASDFEGFLHRAVTIKVNGGPDAYVQLNSNGPDTGEAGWSWWCENFSGGARWLPLGAPHPTQLTNSPHDADLTHL